MADGKETIRLVEYRGLVRLLAPHLRPETNANLERLYEDLLALRGALAESGIAPTKAVEKAKYLIRGSLWLLRRDAEKEPWVTYRQIPGLIDVDAWIEEIVAEAADQEGTPNESTVPKPRTMHRGFAEGPINLLDLLSAELRLNALCAGDTGVPAVSGNSPNTVTKEATGNE